ncbi:MAG: flagellar hook assembly protein FlgD [Gammaproteobacteria bacterium]
MTTAIDNSELFASIGIGAASSKPNKPNDKLLQEDFLELMVAQLKNQDPMKPMESGEFLGDIAQFGTVSGIQDLQESFAALSESIYSNQALQAAALVDRSVLVPLDQGVLPEGGALAGVVELPVSTSQLTVSIHDGAGSLVRRISLGAHAAGLPRFQWDGLMDDGSYATPGRYQVRAEAVIDGETTSLSPLIEAEVRSVTLGGSGQGLRLDLEQLGTIDFSMVRQIL